MTRPDSGGLTPTPFICVTCGTQFVPSVSPPEGCPICLDYRQHVPGGQQRWTTLDRVRADHRIAFQQLEPNLLALETAPDFAIGQRAFLVRTPAGNVLWDCISLIDEATVTILNALGGVHAIAISHPHYYTTMVEWARAFDAPVLLHESDREWVMRPDPVVTFWSGSSRDILPGVRLVHCGGHSAGGAILHWQAGAEGQGALLTGDILQVVADSRWVSFMRSYPNMIPLSAAEVRRIAAIVGALSFERVYGAFSKREIRRDGHRRVQESARRYIAWVTGDESAER